jgi:hypothetical protein
MDEQYVSTHQGVPFILYGAVTYDDVFSVSHWLTYCFTLDKNGATSTAESTMTLAMALFQKLSLEGRL